MSEFAQATVVQTGFNKYSVSHGDDKLLIPDFYDREVLDEAESTKQGRPIHKSIPYVKIIFAGDKTKVIDRPVDLNGVPGGAPPDPMRWPAYWASYTNKTVHVPDGTSLLEWSPLPRAEARDLKSMGIHTVEQLAGLPDTALTWLGAQMWRNKAKAWLASATSPAEVMKIQSENETLKRDVEMLKIQITELAQLKTPENTLKLKQKDDKNV
jgi:hypothetical protein